MIPTFLAISAAVIGILNGAKIIKPLQQIFAGLTLTPFHDYSLELVLKSRENSKMTPAAI